MCFPLRRQWAQGLAKAKMAACRGWIRSLGVQSGQARVPESSESRLATSIFRVADRPRLYRMRRRDFRKSHMMSTREAVMAGLAG